MVTNNNYPTMSTIEESQAPWNESQKEIEVLVSVTLSKKVKVNIPSSLENINYDEDGNSIIDDDVSDIELENAVSEEIFMPQEISQHMRNYLTRHKYKINSQCEKILKDGSGWNIDEFTVIKDE